MRGGDPYTHSHTQGMRIMFNGISSPFLPFCLKCVEFATEQEYAQKQLRTSNQILSAPEKGREEERWVKIRMGYDADHKIRKQKISIYSKYYGNEDDFIVCV